MFKQYPCLVAEGFMLVINTSQFIFDEPSCYEEFLSELDQLKIPIYKTYLSNAFIKYVYKHKMFGRFITIIINNNGTSYSYDYFGNNNPTWYDVDINVVLSYINNEVLRYNYATIDAVDIIKDDASVSYLFINENNNNNPRDCMDYLIFDKDDYQIVKYSYLDIITSNRNLMCIRRNTRNNNAAGIQFKYEYSNLSILLNSSDTLAIDSWYQF